MNRDHDRKRALSFLVVNAGTHPEPREVARGLSEAGHDVTYVTSAQLAPSRAAARSIAMLPPRARESIQARLLPPPFGTAIEARVSSAHLEALQKLLSRRAPVIGEAILRARTRAVGRAAARLHSRRRKRGRPFEAVVAQQTCGAAVFLEAEDAIRILLQPIVDQEWLQRELHLEQVRNPEWAFALQGKSRHPDQMSDLSSELLLAETVVAGSRLVSDSLESNPTRDVLVANYGIDTFFDGVFEQRSARPGHPVRVLFVGQVNQRKGISYLLTAMQDLGTEAELRIAGPVSPQMRERIATLNLTNVTILGPRSQAELRDEYCYADVLVLPSLGEGFALVVGEAMLTGLPCIVTDRVGSNEIINDSENGLIVPIADSEAIADRIRRIAAQPDLLRNLSKHARLTAEQLTWETFRTKVANAIVERVLARQNLS